MTRTRQEELVHFVSDLYSVELQALVQMEKAPDMAGDPTLAADFRTHHAETERQAERIRARLEALGGSPSGIKDAIMKLGGKAFLLFAKLQRETPGRLVAHAYSYEAMEWAGYAMLIRMAELADDAATAELARSIQAEEREMMHRLERGFDAAEQSSHRDTHADDLVDHVRKHLAEAHALGSQNVKLLEKGERIGGSPELAQVYARRLEDKRAQVQRFEQRLRALGARASVFQDAALKLGGLNWSLFFQAQADTPAKLAAFAYAVEHLEIAGHELLLRTARRAGDAETEKLCQGALAEGRASAAQFAESFDASVRATLEAVHR